MWALAIGQPECDRNTSWADAGGDSIAMLLRGLGHRRRAAAWALDPRPPVDQALGDVVAVFELRGTQHAMALRRMSICGARDGHVSGDPDLSKGAGP